MMERATNFRRALVIAIFSVCLIAISPIDALDFGGQIHANTTLALNNSPYIVKEDIIVSENAILNIEPGVKLYFFPGVVLQINGSLQAKGNATHRIAFTKMSTNSSMRNSTTVDNYGIRLADGRGFKVGRLEIFINEKWGTVCDDRFDERSAQVACRQLGFMKAKRHYTHGGGNGPIWLDDLQCSGLENSLLDCKHIGLGTHNCRHDEDVGVECEIFAWNQGNTFFWNGIIFKNSKILSTLQYVDISHAYKAIFGDQYLPELDHVAVTHSAFGVISINLKSPLILTDSAVRNTKYVGVQITGKCRHIQIKNTFIGNTFRADGFFYAEIEETVDFCSVNEANVNLPVTFRAVGQVGRDVECSKVFQSVGGNRLVVYFHSTPAWNLELFVHDGNTTNGNLLVHVKSNTDVYKDILPHSSSGNQIYIRFRCVGCKGGILRFTLTDDGDVPSIAITNSSLIDNGGSGAIIKKFTGKIEIYNANFLRNMQDGLTIESLSGILSAKDTTWVNNTGNGISVTSSFGYVDFRNITALSNKYSGFNMQDGTVSSMFQHSSFSKNEQDGCSIMNQNGGYDFYYCVASSNLRHGIHLLDGTDRNSPGHFKHFTLQNSAIIKNAQYGVNLSPECVYWYDSAVNVTLFISENSITRNHRGGVYVSPQSCSVDNNYDRLRRVKGTINYNYFEQNYKTSFYVHCTGRLGFNAVFSDNTFFNNTGNVITLIDDDNCGSQFKSNPVRVNIRRNSFAKNTAESIIYIDFYSFAHRRSALMKNNTFKQNEPSGYDPFPNTFRRFKNSACVFLKEGNFSFHENIFNNPRFDYEISTARQDLGNIIRADLNWWGTSNECEISDRLFAFHRRVHLSPIKYFPYFLSYNMTEKSSLNTSRPSCFLKGSSIGGSLDRNLTLSSARSPYTVRDDLIVLPHATLTVDPNVTLQFPARATMVVQGRLIANGTVSERIKLRWFQNERRFRLAGGAGRWDGILQILVNDTWWPICDRRYQVTEGKIVCKQLGLEYSDVKSTRVPQDVPGFVHNVICDVDSHDIMSCSRSAWRYEKSCDGHAMYITCMNYKWGGVHLALTQHPSKLHHVYIKDAGYAYRDDIGVPGVALRIDLDQHDISHIYIHNSGGIGVGVTYNNLCNNASIVPMSLISNTASHGFSSMSPWLVLTDLNITQTAGSGFFFSSLWGVANDLADELSSPDMNQQFYICSLNKTFVPGNRVLYFSLERLQYEKQFSCEHIMQTQPGYKIVLQILRHGFAKDLKKLHASLVIFDGMDKSQSSSINLENLGPYDRRVFNFSKSSISFDLFKSSKNNVVFNFFVYTVKENEAFPHSEEGGKITISRSRISDSDTGVLIAGNVSNSVHISDTQITNSRECGIRISSYGHIEITRAHIRDSAYNGISVENKFLKSAHISDTEIKNSRICGIKISSHGQIRVTGVYIRNSNTNGILVVSNLHTFFVVDVDIINSGAQAIGTEGSIDTVKIVSTRIEHQENGIYAESMHPTTDFLIENCVVTVSLYHSIYVGGSVEYGKMRILNSTISHSNRESLYIEAHHSFNLFVNGSTFAWNKNKVVSHFRWHYNENRITMIFESNNFVSNQGPVFYMYDCCEMSLIIRGNKFYQNRASSIINLHAKSLTSCKPTVLVTENTFSTNVCPENAVIFIGSDVHNVVLKKNVFEFNSGRCLLMAGSVADSFSIASNVFYGNVIKDQSLIDFFRIDENAVFINNSFTKNKANGVVSLQLVYKTELTLKSRKFVNFSQNVLFQNFPSLPSGSSNEADQCSMSIFGVFVKEIYIQLNSFDNPEYRKEFCVFVPATSHRDVINISNNWWGTEKPNEIRDRITDFDDNYDYAIAKSWPFLNANRSLTLSLQRGFEQCGRILSGRISESISLKASESPYKITSDLTILKNTTLVVEAGVTLKLLPGVSILVIGALQVKGTPSKPVHFTIDEPTGRNNRSKMVVRLADGSFPSQGMTQLFNGSKWLPLVTSGNLSLPNLTSVICKQLGYGPSITAKEIKISPFHNVSHYFQFHCFGNETTLDECYHLEKNNSSKMNFVYLECHATAWGNVRFISSSDTNFTQQASTLNFVKFSHCGNRHGVHVPAIEAIMNVPMMNAITVQNCTGGGLRIAFPNRNVYINQSSFFDTGGNAVTILQTQRKVLVENSIFRGNIGGVSFEEPNMENVPQIDYGRVFLCSDVKHLHIETTKLLYFHISRLRNAILEQHCEKALSAPIGKGFKVVVLDQSGSKDIQIFDSHSANNKVIDRDVASIVQKDFFIPRSEILLRWNGDSKSKIAVLVEIIAISDMPCTFELDFCGWQPFTSVSVLGREMVGTWYINQHYLTDNSYFSTRGKYLIARNSWFGGALPLAGIISPTIKPQQFCLVRFFCYVRRFGPRSGISIYIITGSSPNFQRRLIWNSRNKDYRWKKVLLRLPRGVDEYRIALVGETAFHIAIDDLELLRCNVGDHRLLNNVFIGNEQHSIQYISSAERADSRPMFVIERSQVMNTLSSTKSVSKSPIFLEIQDNQFTITNNFIANNIFGGIEAKLGGNLIGTGQKPAESSIHGNTFARNTNGAISLAGRSSGIQSMLVKIMKNTFEYNLGPFSTIKLNNIQMKIIGNFFFNNSGQHSVEYYFENDGFKGQTCEMNTFYLNRGSRYTQGVTILTNGPLELHRNNFKNTFNLYELSSTKNPISDTIKATHNWWGVSRADYIRSHIYGKKNHNDFALVNYEPFEKLPPRNILSIGCPPSWQRMGSTCFVVRRGAQTFKEAVEYCQYHGGNVSSLLSPEDKKFFTMIVVESRSEEGHPIAIWLMRKKYLENAQNSKQYCSVKTHEYEYRDVPCTNLYPYICTRTAVTHCPNGCFYNGDCVGTTCFCYRGWTGRDCSQYHCNDVKNCSGNGRCIGPNACKCFAGFLGQGCTFSVCGKFRKCIDCYREPLCGWCDSSQQCIVGTPLRPHLTQCPDWFFYHCHTVGNVSTCSREIMRVDCAMRQCNQSEKTTTLESCQKCHDYEKCFKNGEEGKCRSWNETRCPDGRVHVDYSDPKRVENVVYKKNVKIVDREVTKIYNCPVEVPEEDDSSVLLAPTKLGLKVGDVLLSAQAGGLMHRVSNTSEKGNFTFILGSPVTIKEVISYADFSQVGKAVQIIDETTLDTEPNSEYVSGVMTGSIKLNGFKAHVLSKETLFFKCLGYVYEIGENVIETYYIVMKKSEVQDVSQGNVFVSEQNPRFIERVLQKTMSKKMSFLETEIERCTEDLDLTNRLIKAKSPSEEEVYCFGGDNNNGMIVNQLIDGAEYEEIEVGDLIVGRQGYPVLAKVIGSRISGDYILIEVISVNWISDGIADAGPIDVDQIHRKHRIHRRATVSATFKRSFGGNRYLVYDGKIGKVEIEPSITLDATISVSLTINDEDDDDHISGKLSGSIAVNAKVIHSLKESLLTQLENIVKPKTIAFFIYAVPCEITFRLGGEIGMTLKGKSRTKTVSLGLSQTIFIKPGFSVEGKCSRACRRPTSCQLNYVGAVSTVSDESNTRRSAGSAIETYAQIIPTVDFEVSAFPKALGKLIRAAKNFFRRFTGLFFGRSAPTQETKGIALSVVLSVSWPFRYSKIEEPCSSNCSDGKTRVTSIWTFSTIKGELTANIFSISLSLGPISFTFAKPREKSFCLPCDKGICECTSRNSTTENPTVTSLSEGRDSGMGGSSSTDCEPSCSRYQGCEEPELPAYGTPPICVSGRKGQGCSQPDVEGCSACRNGFPRSTSLGSHCSCSPGWVGLCCEERDRSNNGGDPHLQTLDGIEYDYFGIGEYWACKSIENDFGVQFRFFAYQRASLIGGVSVKAGMSVLTLMTLNYSRPGDLPNLRIDGALINISSYSGQTVTLSNGTVSLSTQETLNFDSQEAAVLLISLQFESGVTVTIDVRYSDVMKRQYLNVLYTLGVDFKGKTEGLCGLMDKDTSNDFTGPNGELFPGPIKFGKSWEITGLRNNSGLFGSWSWTSTNFHIDDVMDSSYNDPHHSPLYTLDGINQIVLAKAVETCSNLGLSNELLKSCIYDVAVTNDTSLADQEEMKPDCPSQCSGKGRCVNSTCLCMAGWSGKSCKIGNCSNCNITNGDCVKGFCQCKDGWEGHTCDVKATCYNVGNCTSVKHGVCQRTDLCRCNDGFIGRDCSIVPTCTNVSDCSGKGICVDYDVCKCDSEWIGKNCTLHSCASLDYCSGRGRCIDVALCVCDPGWTGVSCAVADCAKVSNCSGQGECITSNVCRCYPGFSGSNCTDIANCEHLRNCSGNGACTQEKPGENTTCRCYSGFSGLDCSNPSCFLVNNCSDHGKCIEANLCECDIGYGGANCSIPSCEGVNYCSGHGNCAGYGTCVCDPSWQGPACNLANCSKLHNCNNQGICVLLDTCLCYPGWEGIACNQMAKVNQHAPVINETLYNVSVVENSPVGTKVVRVQANDADTGQIGQMSYLIHDHLNQKPMSTIQKPLFTIDSMSGEIFTSSVFDYESPAPRLFKLNVQVSDNGYPPKSDLTSVHITIEDANDNCPIFKSPLKRWFNLTAKTNPGTLLTEASAVDADSGLNGQVKYSISSKGNHGGDFSIDEVNGSVIVAKELSSHKYNLLFVASDMGLPKCSTEMKMTVNVYGKVSTIVTDKPTGMGTTAKNDVPLTSPSQSWYKEPKIVASAGGALVFIFIVAIVFRKYQKSRHTVGQDNEVGVENCEVKAHPMLRLAWSNASEGNRAESEL